MIYCWLTGAHGCEGAILAPEAQDWGQPDPQVVRLPIAPFQIMSDAQMSPFALSASHRGYPLPYPHPRLDYVAVTAWHHYLVSN